MKTRIEPIDFHVIEEKHIEIDKRLNNWARWAHGGGGNGNVAPMFRMYRPDNFERGPMGTPVDGTDAQRIFKALAHPSFPMAHRLALNWHYIRPINPKKAAQSIGTSLEGLALHVRDGRQILINRRV